jgi:HD-like signal output (HDOD) protein
LLDHGKVLWRDDFMETGSNPIPSSQDRANKTVEVEKKILLKKIAEMRNLPTPSVHIMKIMLLLRNENVRIDKLIEAIEPDQSLVAQILKLINSGYYGLKRNIDTVNHAVNLLGILQIKQLIYSAAIMDIFSDDEKEEWNHAYTCSLLMGNIMKEFDIPAASNLPLTMLMHDIGKVVLRRFTPKKYKLVMLQSKDKNISPFKSEEIILHLNHAETGAMLLEKWQMSEDIIKPVLNHHCKNPPEDYVLETALVQFVNWVDCTCRGIPCENPSKYLLREAGVDTIDHDGWISYQKDLINNLEGDEEADSKEEKLLHNHKTSIVDTRANKSSSAGTQTETAKNIKRSSIPKPETEQIEEVKAPSSESFWQKIISFFKSALGMDD